VDKDLATLIIAAGNRSARELGDISPLIREYCNEDDRNVLQLAIGRAIFEIVENVIGYVSSRNPDLKAEMEHRLKKYHRRF